LRRDLSEFLIFMAKHPSLGKKRIRAAQGRPENWAGP
jgi:hypothetical protein